MRGDGIKDGRGYGPYNMGYYVMSNGVEAPLGPKGEKLTPEYDFRCGPGGYLSGLRPPKKFAGKLPKESERALRESGVQAWDETGWYSLNKAVPQAQENKMSNYLLGTLVLVDCAHVVGGGGYGLVVDSIIKIEAMKTVSVGQAQALVKAGLAIIKKAIDDGFGSQAQTYSNILGHLNWHEENIKKFLKLNDPYPNEKDLREWVVKAYNQYGATTAGIEYMEKVNAQLWSDLRNNAVEMASDIVSLPGKAVKKLVESATGVPMWVWGIGGVVTVGLVALGVYKVAFAAAPSVGRVVAERYLP